MDIIVPLVFFLSNNRRAHQKMQRRRARTFNRRLGLEDFTDSEIHEMFRLNKQAILELYGKIQHKLESPTQRTQAIPGLTKLLAALHYFARGSFQNSTSAKFGLSQATFSRILHQVVAAIISVATEYIQFPKTEAAIRSTKYKFYVQAGFPNVIGIIDCTHVPLIPPRHSEHTFCNQRLYHSINVQIVCGPSMEITDVVARFPGCSHDAYILRNSKIGEVMSKGRFGDSFLLGDNGYPLTKWLMTPYLHPTEEEETKYNFAHHETHSQIERLFGMLKSRFRCLDISGGALLYKPETVCMIIVCCCVLHNIANSHGIPIQLADDLREHISFQGEFGVERSHEGRRRRRRLTNSFFR